MIVTGQPAAGRPHTAQRWTPVTPSEGHRMGIVDQPLGMAAQPLRVMESRAGMSLDDSVYDRLLRERIIFLGQQVDDKIANQICAQLLLLSAEDSSRDINLYINSPGGSVTAGMAIFDTMELIECDVATWAMGLAASMGQFLLSAGTKGKRYALPHSRILMHQGSAGIGGTASDIKIQAEQWNLTKQEMAEITAAHTGQSVEQIIKDGDRDRWFTAKEALEYGFIDHIVARASEVPGGVAPSAKSTTKHAKDGE